MTERCSMSAAPAWRSAALPRPSPVAAVVRERTLHNAENDTGELVWGRSS